MSGQSWQDFFLPGETLLWEGAPSPGIHGRAKIIALAVFGLPFLLAGLGMAGAGVQKVLAAENLGNLGLGLFFAAFSAPFVGIGAVMVVGQWYAARQAHLKTRYALSSRAAYVAQSLWKHSIECYPILPNTASGLEKGHGVDTVWFHVRTETNSDNDATTSRIGFENIANGEHVFRLIRSLQSREIE